MYKDIFPVLEAERNILKNFAKDAVSMEPGVWQDCGGCMCLIDHTKVQDQYSGYYSSGNGILSLKLAFVFANR